MSRGTEGGGALERYLSSIRRFRSMDRSEEAEAVRRARVEGDTDGLNDLVCSNLAFVVKVAAEFRGFGVPFEDLLNCGNVGLIEASRRFDPDRGTKFITYAVWWIRKSILEAVSSQVNVVHVPKYRMRKLRRIRAAEDDLSKRLGRAPTRDEISRQLQAGVTRIDEDMKLARPELSLDQPVGEDGMTAGQFLEDRGTLHPEEKVLRAESTRLVREVLERLDDRERLILVKRFGLMGERELSLKEIGKRLGLSRERVRQIQAEVLGKIRKILDHWTSPPGSSLSGLSLLSRAPGGAGRGGRSLKAGEQAPRDSGRRFPPPARPSPPPARC